MLRIPLITFVFMQIHNVLDQIFTGRPSIIWFKNHVFTNFLVTCYTLQDCFRLLYCRQNCMELSPKGGFLLSSFTNEVPAEEFIVSTVAALHFHHLFNSWFNRGFLVIKNIGWDTPASILEKIIEYEAVHKIKSWDDLRRRIEPPDRFCFAFFHPALIDEPLIFVEIALESSIPSSVQSLLEKNRIPIIPERANTAIFYSISNCQKGLRGVTFGNFLIKQVVEELIQDLPQLKTFVTLSPIPGFRNWLGKEIDNDILPLKKLNIKVLGQLENPEWYKLNQKSQ